MDNKSGKRDNSHRKESVWPDKMLQAVYDAIKRERPWDIRPVNKMYTTAKEKYMIELIKDGHDISEETIKHVAGRCYKFHDFDDGKYVCWFGFILTKIEYPREHFQCQSFHHLNHRLVCHNGGIYYPVDILSNPFGEWRPEKLKVKPEIQKVYTMIREKWPNHWYGNELHKYTLKHLIHLIETGEELTEDVKSHVVDGCDIDHHKLDGNYNCYSGFLLRQNQITNTECFRFYDGMLEYVMNPKFQHHTGIIGIPVSQLKFRNHQTAQQIIYENNIPWPQSVNKIGDRIIQRDMICPESTSKIQLTWQEYYLKELLILGVDIPNEVISHVLDGCYAYNHRLTEQYTCCRGYILHRTTYFDHEGGKCMSSHMINQDLNCYEGRIYHRCAEIPIGSFKSKSRWQVRDEVIYGSLGISAMDFFDVRDEDINGSLGFSAMDLGEVIDQRDRAQVVRPALPPRDHLDQPPDADAIQWNLAAERQNFDAINDRDEMVPPDLPPRDYLRQPPDADVIQWNRAAERRNVDVIDNRDEMVGGVPYLKRHLNPAPPPLEVDI